MAGQERIVDNLVVLLSYRTNTASATAAEARINRLRGKMNTLSRSFTRAGILMTGALVGVAVPLVSTSEAMNTLEARSGATADQMKRFRDQAIEVGSQLPLNTADIIRAQTAYIQLGNSIEQTIKATPGIALAAAAAESVEVGDAARYASLGLRAFNLEADRSTNLLDAMLKAETTTPATMRQIGEAFRFSAQAAADAGLDYQTYIATLGTLGGSGRSPEEASQGMNVIFTQLAKGVTGIARGGKMVMKALGKVGIEGDELQDFIDRGAEGFIDLLKRLKQVRSEYGQTSLTAILSQLVGTSYSSAFSYLVQNVDELVDVQAKLYDSAGEGARHAEIQMSNLSGAVKSFRAMLDTVIHKLTGVEKGLEGVIRKVTEFLHYFAEAPPLVHKLTAAVLLAGPAVLGLGLALKGASLALGGFLPAARIFRRLGRAAAAAALTVRAVWMATAGGVIQAYNLMLARGMTSTAAMAVIWRQSLRQMRLAFATFAGSIGAIWTSFMAVMTGGAWLAVIAAAGLLLVAWKPVSTFLRGFVDRMRLYLPDIADVLRRIVRTLSDLPIIGGAIARLADLFGSLEESGASFADSFGQWLIQTGLDLNEWLEGVVSRIEATSWGQAVGRMFAEGFLSMLPGFGTAWGRDLQERWADDRETADLFTERRQRLNEHRRMVEELGSLPSGTDDEDVNRRRDKLLEAIKYNALEYGKAAQAIQTVEAVRAQSEAARQTQGILSSYGAGGYMTRGQWEALQERLQPTVPEQQVVERIGAPPGRVDVGARTQNVLNVDRIEITGTADDPQATSEAVRQGIEDTFATMAEDVQSPVDR